MTAILPQRTRSVCLALLASFTCAILPARAEETRPSVSLPPALPEQVSFREDIEPILYKHCASCHAGAHREGGFSITTRDELLKGGATGPAVIVGKSQTSLLISLVGGLDESRAMPMDGPRLSSEQIGALRAWIDQGLNWEKGFRFGGIPRTQMPLRPRRPDLPRAAGDGSENPIDRILQPYFREHGVDADRIVSDRLYARRVYLDLIGLLPSPDALAEFERDSAPDKRARLVRRLLDDRRNYADHWLTFWNDALRNAYRGTGFIDDGRTQITGWLYAALYNNKPYDEFVRELVSPVDASRGFLKGIQWRGVVNASQRPEMQAAQNIAQVFLGTNLKCASCHDSFVNDWKLHDAYALAGVFAEEPLEVHRCDKTTGEFVGTAFIYPELGAISPEAPREERLKRLAELLTDPRNGRLPRAVVNRLWARLLGRGIVEPVDEIDAAPWNRDLLDWLAVDLQDHKYDLQHTLEIICNSRAYQLPSVDDAANDGDAPYVFRGPLVKRLSAEQFVDAVSTVTGVWQEVTPEMKKLDGRKQGGQLAEVEEVTGSLNEGQVRASLAFLDPLMAALGRPNREQVVTRRDSRATMLEALELTNGEALDRVLRAGARKRLERDAAGTDQIVRELYNAALARDPNPAELAIAKELAGEPATEAGLADVLWTLVLLPEFQLVN